MKTEKIAISYELFKHSRLIFQEVPHAQPQNSPKSGSRQENQENTVDIVEAGQGLEEAEKSKKLLAQEYNKRHQYCSEILSKLPKTLDKDQPVEPDFLYEVYMKGLDSFINKQNLEEWKEGVETNFRRWLPSVGDNYLTQGLGSTEKRFLDPSAMGMKGLKKYLNDTFECYRDICELRKIVETADKKAHEIYIKKFRNMTKYEEEFKTMAENPEEGIKEKARILLENLRNEIQN